MLLLIVLTIVAVLVAVGALQNGQPVMVSFLVWHFEAPLALVILTAAAGGLLLGALVSWVHGLRRRRRRPGGPLPLSDATPREAAPVSSASSAGRAQQ